MPRRTIPNLVCATVLLATAAFAAPPAYEDSNRIPRASAARAKHPLPTVCGSACFSASMYETRRDGKIDCFYKLEPGTTCLRAVSGFALLNDQGS